MTKSIYDVEKSYLRSCISSDSVNKTKSFSLKSIIDIYASSYRYIELISALYDICNQKSYRGFTWISQMDLSKQLGYSDGHVSRLLKDGKYNSCEEIIDAHLDGILRIRNIYSKGSYKGFIWKDAKDLSKQLGRSITYVGYLIKSGKYNSFEEIIDAYLDGLLPNNCNSKRFMIHGGSYKGFIWKDGQDLSKQLGYSGGHVSRLLKNGKYNSCEEIIDAYLDGEITKPEVNNGSYRGYTWNNQMDLSKQLGFDGSYVSRALNEGKYNSCEEIIDAYLNRIIKPRTVKPCGGSYRGYIWASEAELTRLLGKGANYVNRLKNQKHLTIEQIIDECLDGKPKKYSCMGYEWNSDVELAKILKISEHYITYHRRSGKTFEEIINNVLHDRSNKNDEDDNHDMV